MKLLQYFSFFFFVCLAFDDQGGGGDKNRRARARERQIQSGFSETEIVYLAFNIAIIAYSQNLSIVVIDDDDDKNQQFEDQMKSESGECVTAKQPTFLPHTSSTPHTHSVCTNNSFGLNAQYICGRICEQIFTWIGSIGPLCGFSQLLILDEHATFLVILRGFLYCWSIVFVRQMKYHI